MNSNRIYSQKIDATRQSESDLSAGAENRVCTILEVARRLRCSKAHVCNIIRGKVPNLPSLPVLRIGRRLLIRNGALLEWMRAVEVETSGVR